MKQVVKEEDMLHVKERTQLIEANTEMFQALKLPDRDFKEARINKWKGWMTCVNRWELLLEIQTFLKSQMETLERKYIGSKEFIQWVY